MIREFKEFLLKQNAVALAIGVIIGAAIGKVVSSLVENVLNPIISLLLPAGDWRSAGWVLREGVDAAGKPFVTKITYGQVIGAIVDFVIIGLVVFLITKAFLPKPEPAAPTKECPQCREIIPKLATRCKACAQPVVA
jgi:large conductance mechanosensitive channel